MTALPEEGQGTLRGGNRHLRHEMRTQLNHILGYAELLLDDVPDHAGPAIAALADIVGAGQRANAAFGEFLLPSSLDRETSLGAVRRALQTIRDLATGLLARASDWDGDATVDIERIRSAVARALALADDIRLADDGRPGLEGPEPPLGAGGAGHRTVRRPRPRPRPRQTPPPTPPPARRPGAPSSSSTTTRPTATSSPAGWDAWATGPCRR